MLKAAVAILFFSIGLIACSEKQFAIQYIKRTKIPKRHQDTYSVADSLRQSLVQRGIKNLIFYYRWRTDPDALQNTDDTQDVQVAFLLWKDVKGVYYQKINDFAIYRPVIAESPRSYLMYIFDFYTLHKDSINREVILSKATRTLPDTLSLEQLSKLAGVTIFHYTMDDVTRTLYWGDLGSRSYDYQDHLLLQDLSKKIVTWFLIVDKTYRERQSGGFWEPLNIKYWTAEQKRQMIREARKELKRYKMTRQEKKLARKLRSKAIADPPGKQSKLQTP